ncbi:NAD(P)-dependent alcohol dehydrogenase [Lysobacter fragariae]
MGKVAVTAAVVREKSGRFEIEALDMDEPRAGEVLVRIVGTGICHNDITARDQQLRFPLPAVLGHEGAGIVQAVGPGVTKVQAGDAVVLTFASCGSCPNCQRARYTYCQSAATLNRSGVRAVDGSHMHRTRNGETVSGAFFGQSSFASHALAPERSVVRIPSDVPVELMGPLGCGIQTGAGAVINVLKPKPGSSIAIFGVGAVGMAALMAARALGCGTIIAVDINPARLKLAEELGATHTIDNREGGCSAEIRGISDGGVQYSVTCVGEPAVLREAVLSLRTTGECVSVATAPSQAEVSVPMNFLLAGRSVRGVLEGDSIPDLFIPELIDLWRQNRFPFDRLVRFYDLADINKAIAAVQDGSVLKPIVRPRPW